MPKKSQSHKSRACAESEEALPNPAATSKQDIVVSLLRRDQGAPLDELVQATGWQKHSVRGLISGALKKTQGLNVVSEKTAEGSVYRIVPPAGEANDAG
jgi:hypothetical protein